MKKPALLVLVLLLLPGVAAPAGASDYHLRSQTYVRGYPFPGATDTSNIIPFYEFLHVRSRDLGGVSGLSLDASLWGAVHFADVLPDDTRPQLDSRLTGDVSLLMLGYQAPDKSALRGLRLRVGRQFVAAGPSILEQLDGVYADYRPPSGLELTLFGGAPTGVRFVRQPWPLDDDDVRYGFNWAVGGRLGYSYRGLVGAGASYRHKRFDGSLAAHEIGADLTVSPWQRLGLQGDGVADLVSQRLKELRGIVRVDVLDDLAAAAGYRFVSPDLFIPRTSIFAIFSNEEYQEAFAEVHWAMRRWLSLTASGGALVFGEACIRGELSGEQCEGTEVEARAELRADVRLGRERRHRVTFEAERRGAPEGGYTRFRLATARPLWHGTSVIADVDFFLLDNAQSDVVLTSATNATRLSITGAAYVSWALRPNLSLLAGGQLMRTPLFSSAGSFLVRLTWQFDRVPPPPTVVDPGAAASVAMTRGPVPTGQLAMAGVGGIQ